LGSIGEALRMVTSLQFHEENGEACPADFNDGRDGLVDTAQGIAGYLATH
jgi:peroxiredoxin (alkyl hydroperoxide reductase subunit C)